MAETRPRRARLRLLAAGLWALAAGACYPPAPAAPPPALASRSLSGEEIAAIAELLKLEDARTAAPDRLAGLAASLSPHVRARAALALGRSRSPESAPLLATLLHDSDTAVAALAAFSLGQLGDTSFVPLLTSTLEVAEASERPTVAAEAAYALGKLGTETAHRSLQRLLAASDLAGAEQAVVESALLAVWRFPRPADLAPVTRWMSSPSPEIRWRAAYALVRRVDARAAAYLLDATGDPSAEVRALAHRGLTAALADSASLRAEDVIELHRVGTADPEYPVRINAIRALGSFPTHGAAEAVRPLLESPERHAVVVAIESLGRIGGAAGPAAPRLAALARSPEEHVFVRQSALEALALVDSELARQVALELRDHASWRLRLGSARAFAAGAPIGAEQRTLIADRDARVAAGALAAAIAVPGDSLPPLRNVLIEQLASPDPGVRTTALQGLGRLRDPGTLTAILDAYARAQHDPDSDASLAALDALAELRSARLDPTRAFFARFPRAPDYLVRRRAEELFGEAAAAAWGDVGPIETRHSSEVYRTLTERWSALPAPEHQPVVEIVTSLGSFRVRLFGDWAPLTVHNLLSLAAQGYFDGQEWPRVVPNFVVQGGDPRGDMTGGPGYAIRDEINPLRYGVGSVGMALSGPDTGGSQFFVTHSAQPHLDGIYTLFGEMLTGHSVLERLLPGDRIVTVRQVDGAGE